MWCNNALKQYFQIVFVLHRKSIQTFKANSNLVVWITTIVIFYINRLIFPIYMVILHSPIDISFCRILPMLGNTRITKHNRMTRYIAVNITIRRNQNIIANSYVANDSSVYTNPNFITDNRSSLSAHPDSFVQREHHDVCLYFCLKWH